MSSTPTAAQCKAYREQLAAAEAAEVALVTTGQVVAVKMGEHSVQYAPAKSGDLSALIGRLREQVARCDGCGGGGRLIGVMPGN